MTKHLTEEQEKKVWAILWMVASETSKASVDAILDERADLKKVFVRKCATGLELIKHVLETQ